MSRDAIILYVLQLLALGLFILDSLKYLGWLIH